MIPKHLFRVSDGAEELIEQVSTSSIQFLVIRKRFEGVDEKILNIYTGCSIKIQSHYFNHISSHKRNTSKFKTKFIYYYIELSFEVYNTFLGQLV